ncbi:MAG: zf-HC2 domain-containing protein [Desulfobacterota bacterium]|nr:zf-HC2 domain-containing protein [Thermodesulfobacteriota bacterium]
MKGPCQSITRLLERYFDHQATEEEKALVEHHLRTCKPCTETLQGLERLRAALKAPVEEALKDETFPWIWEKIERGLREQKEPSWWEGFRSSLDLAHLMRKKIWVPAVVTAATLLLFVLPLLFKKTPSDLDRPVVEFIESGVYNVMVYESEKEKVTVIWLFEGNANGFPLS